MCYIFWNFIILWRAYRLCAYRLYTSWVYGRLGLHCRRVIPACVVTTIRAAFPADHGQYTGFMEASGDDLSMWPWWSGISPLFLTVVHFISVWSAWSTVSWITLQLHFQMIMYITLVSWKLAAMICVCGRIVIRKSQCVFVASPIYILTI